MPYIEQKELRQRLKMKRSWDSAFKIMKRSWDSALKIMKRSWDSAWNLVRDRRASIIFGLLK